MRGRLGRNGGRLADYLAVLGEAQVPESLLVWQAASPSHGPGRGDDRSGGELLLRLESRVDRDGWRDLHEIEKPVLVARRAADSDTRRASIGPHLRPARTGLRPRDPCWHRSCAATP